MSSQIVLLEKLKKSLLMFIDELISILPNESDLLIVRFFLKDNIPISDVMDYTIKKILPLEEFVLTKNDKFFLENNVMFEELREDYKNLDVTQKEKINYFKNIWLNDLDEDNKNVIWDWFKLFLNIAKTYNKST